MDPIEPQNPTPPTPPNEICLCHISDVRVAWGIRNVACFSDRSLINYSSAPCDCRSVIADDRKKVGRDRRCTFASDSNGKRGELLKRGVSRSDRRSRTEIVEIYIWSFP